MNKIFFSNEKNIEEIMKLKFKIAKQKAHVQAWPCERRYSKY
jgi:hypothetical protein